MIATLSAITHPGQVRDNNEDTVAIGNWIRNAPMDVPIQLSYSLEQPLILMVADGMGGHNAGEVASQLVAETLFDLLAEAHDEKAIQQALVTVNGKVYEKMETSPSLRGMGSTVVGAILHPSGSWIFHVGDSRAYQIRNGFLAQLTRDDTLALSHYGDAIQHEKSGMISQALGGAEHFAQISPNLQAIRLSPGATWLFCSDGLSDMLSLDELEAALQSDLDASVSAMLEKTLQAGGHDNISIIMLRIESELSQGTPSDQKGIECAS